MGAPKSHGLRELLREMSLEYVKRAVQAPGFLAQCFGQPHLKVRYGRLNRGHDCGCISWVSLRVATVPRAKKSEL